MASLHLKRMSQLRIEYPTQCIHTSYVPGLDVDLKYDGYRGTSKKTIQTV